MPVTDINAVAMGESATNIFSSMETTSGFFQANADFVAWIVIFAVFVALMAIAFIVPMIAKALLKKR